MGYHFPDLVDTLSYVCKLVLVQSLRRDIYRMVVAAIKKCKQDQPSSGHANAWMALYSIGGIHPNMMFASFPSFVNRRFRFVAR